MSFLVLMLIVSLVAAGYSIAQGNGRLTLTNENDDIIEAEMLD